MTHRYQLLDPQGQNLLIPKEGEATDVAEFEVTRLQALLSQWLRMENVVAFLAAGCSISQGGLAIGGLERSTLQFLQSSYDSQGNGPLRDFVQSRLDNPGHITFEQWLSYISNIAYLSSVSDQPVEKVVWNGGIELSGEQLATLLEDLSKTIFAFCSLKLPERIEGASGHHAFLGKMVARDPTLGRLKVFTLNYDTLIEQALDHLGIQYADGFVGQVERRFDPSCYGLDIYYPGEVSEGRVRRYDKFVQLYKLHGSIHWGETDGNMKAIHPALEPFVAWRQKLTGDQAAQQEAIGELSGLFTHINNQMGILPTANKYVQTLDLPYSHLFRAFQQTLQQPQTFVVVAGYGFGDDHVNRIIEDALINPSLIMLVINPSSRQDIVERIKKYQRAGARIYLLTGPDNYNGNPKHKPATFDDFAINILPNVSWMDDWARLKRMESTLKRDRIQGMTAVEENKDEAEHE
ncbi:MAG: SIR2 family protein [Candidatus Thiodiazotropha sp. (ex Ctena orbiculata)]|nr:SIR2 family protein [Candidatus Thiodiazotropha taylori]MBT3034323.1 SIR2 family protein [Candidatus Thiodiazotropha taylori]